MDGKWIKSNFGVVRWWCFYRSKMRRNRVEPRTVCTTALNVQRCAGNLLWNYQYKTPILLSLMYAKYEFLLLCMSWLRAKKQGGGVADECLEGDILKLLINDGLLRLGSKYIYWYLGICRSKWCENLYLGVYLSVVYNALTTGPKLVKTCNPTLSGTQIPNM